VFSISVETYFRASHRLAFVNGSRERLHKHKWIVTAAVSGTKLNKMGLVIDFCRLKKMVDEVLSGLNGRSLESVDYFRQNAPSAENVAIYIYEKLKPGLPRGVRLDHVDVIEQPGCSARFSK